MTERFTDDAVLQQAPGALSRRLLDGVLVLGPHMSEPMRTSAPGGALWAMLHEPCMLVEIIEAWTTAFDVPETTARADVEPVLAAWYEGGALVVVDRSE